MRQQEAASQMTEKRYALIEVEVTQMSGEALASLSLRGTCVIRDVKLKLERQQGIPHQQAQLVVPGAFNKLEDHKTIADCGVSGGKLLLILVRNSGFLPSKRFDGSLEGYVFKLGDQGLGYYIDSMQRAALTAEHSQPATAREVQCDRLSASQTAWPSSMSSANEVMFHDGPRFVLDATTARQPRQLAAHELEFQSQLEAGGRLLGLDMEWEPDRYKGQDNKVALVQIALGGAVWLVRTCQIRLPDFVRRALVDSSVIKGVACFDAADREKLKASFGIQIPKNPEAAGYVDISLLAKECSFPGFGVKKLCDRYGLRIEKNVKTSCSKWAAATLSEAQVQYACDDAYFTLLLLGKLLQEGSVRKSELRSRARAACGSVLPTACHSLGRKDMSKEYALLKAFLEELCEATARACKCNGEAKIPLSQLGGLLDSAGTAFVKRAQMLNVSLSKKFLKEQHQLFVMSSNGGGDFVRARSAAERAPFKQEELSLPWASSPKMSLQTWLALQLQPPMDPVELSGRLCLLARALDSEGDSAAAVELRALASEGVPSQGCADGTASSSDEQKTTVPPRKAFDPKTTVVVRGIPKDWTQEAFRTTMELQFGSVSELLMPKDKGGRHRGLAFVSFQHPAVAEQILQSSHAADALRDDAQLTFDAYIPRA
ncbi:wrn [Symbiodinium natans]|uniref:Wrn protein n=1 Tax=Symbiodinium natans TaxID=878477 RepID=A0A812LBF9_9DINO|nr:wrn [Symbiodinium natans]